MYKPPKIGKPSDLSRVLLRDAEHVLVEMERAKRDNARDVERRRLKREEAEQRI